MIQTSQFRKGERNNPSAEWRCECVAKSLGVVARAKGMSQIASETGLSREQLYRLFSDMGNPMLKTTLAVMQVLGLDITAKRHS